MASRIDLHEKLCEILGSRNVYFQPPSTLKMKYDAIVYSLDDVDSRHADDIRYISKKRYKVTVISKDPDTELQDKLLEFPYCDLDRFYPADNLNHWVFTLYF